MDQNKKNTFNAMRVTPLTAVFVSSIALFGSAAAYAAEGDKADSDKDKQVASNETLEEVVSLGTRSTRPRTASDSTVPIDSISGDEFGAVGNAADITDNLKAYVPSYTATPATGDGSAFVRPTSLRGLAPDQMLVLVNGKRRHRSALVQFFAPAAGNGAHGPDIGMIPSIALKRVDVLRDGAASQYGSDAIAGVMNFVTKDANDGGSLIVQYGQYYEGEISQKVAGNNGVQLGDNGFLNLSAEYVYNEGLSRGKQRPDAQALIDAGVQGVGQDSPFDDAPFAQSWGRPENRAVRFFLNGGVELNQDAELYFFGNYAETKGIYRFFYRPGDNPATGANEAHSTIQTLQASATAQGGTFTDPIVNTGYTPHLNGDQTDVSAIGGLRGELASEWNYDLSLAYGSNLLDYTLFNTTNPTLGVVDLGPTATSAHDFVIPQRNFNVGAYRQTETNINLDLSKLVTDTLNVAYGFEWRQEVYEAIQGETSSFIGSGANGLRGIGPSNAGEFRRHNLAAYVELEKEFTEDFLVQGALRYEDFSDFGNTTNGKLAARYNVTQDTAIRGSVSTGFHAPTPGQANVTTTITTFDGVTGLQQEEGLVKPTSAIAQRNGGTALKEETSVNVSLGFTSQLGESSTLTVDAYQIKVDDRIYRTGDITDATTGSKISFYTNALDIESKGIDLVFSTNFDVYNGSDLTLAASYNKLDVTGQTAVNTPSGPINPVSDGTVEDIENNYPNLRFVLTSNTYFNDQWSLMLRANYYGSHFDERGRIGGDPGTGANPSAEIDPVVFIDTEVGFNVNEELKIVVGGTNIFDTFVDEIDSPNANRQSVGLQYPRRSAANYEGGSWYVAAHYNF